MTSTEKPVNVLIADSQFLVTESLRLILRKDGRFHVNDIVSEKNEIFKALIREKALILIIDPSLIDLGTIAELKEITVAFPYLKLLVITNSLNKSELHELNNMGITGIILKTSGEEEIFEALNSTIRGKKYYSNELLEVLFEADDRKNTGEEISQLTISEIEIVRLISEGLTTKEIALRKFISFHTVITHRKNIFRKLGVSSVSELLMYAIKAGWINMIEYHI